MAAYRFTPKIPGMPTDAQIIMHVLKYYLKLKEPYAIPPLVPVSHEHRYKLVENVFLISLFIIGTR